MANLPTLRARAAEIEAELGLRSTPTRVLNALRAEFRHVDRDMLVIAAGLRGAPTGVHPIWTGHSPHLKVCTIRQWGSKRSRYAK